MARRDQPCMYLDITSLSATEGVEYEAYRCQVGQCSSYLVHLHESIQAHVELQRVVLDRSRLGVFEEGLIALIELRYPEGEVSRRAG